jgi:capsule polysaccharide export protein KpsE/RkpR
LPLQNADTFSLIQQQNAEIKTTVLEMKTSLGALTTKLDQNQRQTADQQARITGLETNAQANRDNIVQLSDRVSQLEHKDRGR